MATVSLSASARNEFGKGSARKARAAGHLPAIIYRAGQPATAINLDGAALELAFQRTANRNTLVDLDVDGTSHVCLVKDTQRDPVTAILQHVDFYEVDNTQEVVVDVPVAATGHAIGMEEGGVLRMVRRSLKVRCKPDQIPDAVEIDITQLDVGDYIRVSAVTAPAGTELAATTDFNVLAVVGRRINIIDEPVVEVEGEEGEEGVEDAEGEESAEGTSEADGE